MKKSELYRNCPSCNKPQFYSRADILRRAIKNNGECKSCAVMGDKHPLFGKFGENHPKFGSHPTDETRKKMSIWHMGKIPSEYTKQKHRINRQKQLDLTFGTTFCNYNPFACVYFDALSIDTGWNLQHALNGGELRMIGYSIDAYDKELNIVVEYDEPDHYVNEKLTSYDIVRMENIITKLNCEFYRYNERTQELIKHY